jgi:hypothetical protein
MLPINVMFHTFRFMFEPYDYAVGLYFSLYASYEEMDTLVRTIDHNNFCHFEPDAYTKDFIGYKFLLNPKDRLMVELASLKMFIDFMSHSERDKIYTVRKEKPWDSGVIIPPPLAYLGIGFSLTGERRYAFQFESQYIDMLQDVPLSVLIDLSEQIYTHVLEDYQSLYGAI